MNNWLQPEWRIPRRGEVVKAGDNTLGWVLRSEGTFVKRILWVLDERGNEIYSGEPAEAFHVVKGKEEKNFQLRRYNHLGYVEGALCSYTKVSNVPLEIIQMEWNQVRNKMTFCLKNLREFDGEIMKTEDDSLIPLFDENFPDLENIFSTSESGLKYRIDIGLSETIRNGWGNNGSPWEFFSKDDAHKEIESWKCRLKARRIASVIGSDWKIEFPAWTIETKLINDQVFSRVSEVKAFNGSPCYFKSALHAAVGMKMISPSDWHKALFSTQDILNF